MARPIFSSIQSGIEGWDANLTDNFMIVLGGDLVNGGPFPIRRYGSFGQLQSLAPAAQNDECLAIYMESGSAGSGQPRLAISHGTGTPPGGTTGWSKIPVQAAVQAAFVGADITALKGELNTFLQKLRDANVIAT